MEEQNNLTFALDIGTRTIIGLIVKDNEIIGSKVIEHENRAMLDGQIHNVKEVARQVKKVKEDLEERLGIKLKKTAIAAAGRALKTVVKKYKLDFSAKKTITEQDVQALELAAIQEAQEELVFEKESTYHFVGYSVIEYNLDGMFLGSLVGQSGKSIEVELVVTFLPRVVIDSLLNVINQVGLEVEHLTLEPIAAANITIPKEMFNFNLALVDIGAGTSDIALTKGGAMTGYAMVPVAGDEITETLAEHYLLDYNTGEKVKRLLQEKESVKVKNILGKEQEIKKEEAIDVIYPQVKKLVELITAEIMRINSKSPQAVMCIGGGSLSPYLVKELAQQLDIPSDRVAIKLYEDLDKIEGQIAGVSSPQALTPIGIALTAEQSSSRAIFVNVEVNNNPVQIFTLGNPTVADALLAAEVDVDQLQGRPGMGLTCTVNGELKSIRGTMGKPGSLFLNGEEVDLDSPINSGDQIEFNPGENGDNAQGIIADVLPSDFEQEKKITINDEKINIKTDIYQNGKHVTLETPIQDGAEIIYNENKTIRQAVAQFLEVNPVKFNDRVVEVIFNGKKKTITTSDFIIKEKGQLVDLDSPLVADLNLEIAKDNSQGSTVKDLWQKENSCHGIKIIFNGTELDIPLKNWDITCNGKEVNYDYKPKDGDEINCKPGEVSIKKVFDYINYPISPAREENMAIMVNGEQVDLAEKVKHGDNIRIKFKNYSSNKRTTSE